MNKMMKKLKVICIFSFLFTFAGILSSVDAASATISASSKSVNAGDSVSIYVNINAAAWNVHVNGTGLADSIVGYDEDGNNKATSKTYALNTGNPGTYTVSISGDVTDASSDNSNVSGTVTVVVNPKPESNPKPNDTQNNNNQNNNNQNNNNTQNNPTSNNVVVDTRSKNANLSSLSIDGVEFSPEFNPDNTTYNATVKHDITELNISAIPQDDKSTTVVEGNIDLVEGDNNVTITVTAENGYKKVYTIIVKKEKNPDDMNAFLSSIVINNATLKKDFETDVFDYMCDDISADILKLDIVVTTQIEGATYEIIGNDELKSGINYITVKVKSRDESDTKEYNIIVFKTDEVLAMQEEPAIDEVTKIITLLKENIIYVIMYAFILIEFLIIVVLFAKLNKYKNRIKTVNNKINENTDEKVEDNKKDSEDVLIEQVKEDEVDTKIEENEENDEIKTQEVEDIKDNIEEITEENIEEVVKQIVKTEEKDDKLDNENDDIKSKMDLDKVLNNKDK